MVKTVLFWLWLFSQYTCFKICESTLIFGKQLPCRFKAVFFSYKLRITQPITVTQILQTSAFHTQGKTTVTLTRIKNKNYTSYIIYADDLQEITTFLFNINPQLQFTIKG
jgi:hypothetical protein